jgi:hypothetical protein
MYVKKSNHGGKKMLIVKALINFRHKVHILDNLSYELDGEIQYRQDSGYDFAEICYISPEYVEIVKEMLGISGFTVELTQERKCLRISWGFLDAKN